MQKLFEKYFAFFVSIAYDCNILEIIMPIG